MVAVKNLSKSFEGHEVLSDISFSVSDRETLAICGKSGCGKTTLLRIIAGLEKDYLGDVFLNGMVVDTRVAPYDRDIAFVFQEATLWNHMSVYENIAYGMKKKERQKIEKIAKELQIEELLRRYPTEISGGQAKRVSMARAFASDRSIILLDEPMSNIDQETKGKILAYIKAEYCGKKTILYVTHDPEETRALNCEVMNI